MSWISNKNIELNMNTFLSIVKINPSIDLLLVCLSAFYVTMKLINNKSVVGHRTQVKRLPKHCLPLNSFKHLNISRVESRTTIPNKTWTLLYIVKIIYDTTDILLVCSSVLPVKLNKSVVGKMMFTWTLFAIEYFWTNSVDWNISWR